jgi:transcription initiation factor TFIIH subunit 1
MARIQGHATHKKRAGLLTITEDTFPAMLIWRCADSQATTNLVELALDTVSYLKATPPTSDKMMLKIGMENNKELLFGFNSRKVMDDVKVSIQQIIARKKTSINLETEKKKEATNVNADVLGTVIPVSELTESSVQPELETSNEPDSLNSQLPDDSGVKNDVFLAELLDSSKLIKNLALQQKLLRDNIKLMRTFTEAVIKEGMEAEEFWKSRIHLLRSFAIQNNQKKGPYNVLSTIKPVASSDNEVNVNVTRDKIKEIFKQYPIVRKAYDDNVPRMSEGEFWSRFFSSKLFRKLRGEKINLYDRGDVTLDKYLYYDADYDGEEEIEEDENVDHILHDEKAQESSNKQTKKRKLGTSEKMAKRKKVRLFNEIDTPIPKFLDIEGNKEDDPQLRGNKPDITMKDDQDPQLVGILRTMNRLSRRLMADITDVTPVANLDKEFEKELELVDLDETAEVEYNELKYTQTSNVASNIVPSELLEKVFNQSNLNPEPCEYDEIIKTMKDTFNTEFDLTCAYTNMKKEGKKQNDAYKDINNIVKQNAKQSQQSWNTNLKELLGLPSSAATSSAPENTDYDIGIKINLENKKIESVKLTHATSIEFLRQFWTQFNLTAASTPATDPNFKSDLIKLRKYYFSVKKCLGRVEAQLANCKDSNERIIENRMLDPLVQALNCALKKYEDAIVTL